jgi:hypothetical protein
VIYESVNQKKVRIMTDLKVKVAITAGPKGVGAATSKELADLDECWVTHLAVPVAGEGR